MPGRRTRVYFLNVVSIRIGSCPPLPLETVTRGRTDLARDPAADPRAHLAEALLMVELLGQAHHDGTRVQFSVRDDPLLHAHREDPAMAALLRPR
ncbi:MAG: hypothetical protein EA422_13610 [Gemmatimonadales bacterium]|nr:MAG: hypothetical protein EA422_13610 [Gemmatimonadales bacterium]